MAKDIFHDAVKRALAKEGWIITHDPYAFELGEVSFRIDLGAERVIAAEKGGEKYEPFNEIIEKWIKS